MRLCLRPAVILNEREAIPFYFLCFILIKLFGSDPKFYFISYVLKKKRNNDAIELD